jgi:hypothetical protein
MEHTDVASAGAVTLDDLVGCNERQLVERHGLGLSGIRRQALEFLHLVLVCLCVGFCDLERRRFHVFPEVPGGRVSEQSNSDLAHGLIESSEQGDRRARQYAQTAECKVVAGLSAYLRGYEARDQGTLRRTNVWAAAGSMARWVDALGPLGRCSCACGEVDPLG